MGPGSFGFRFLFCFGGAGFWEWEHGRDRTSQGRHWEQTRGSHPSLPLTIGRS